MRTLFGIPWAYPQSYDWNHRRVALAWLLFVGAEAALGWALIRTLEEW